MGNKENLYALLKVDRKTSCWMIATVGLFLPPYERCSTECLKALLAKKKPVRVSAGASLSTVL